MITPAQNRVTPFGDIVAARGRGAWMGNRGILHDGTGTREVVRRSRSRAWITCVLSFRGRHVPQWRDRRYTPLFFLDEALSFAAGHRPCAECRRADFTSYRAAWGEATSTPLPYAREMDAVLQAERGRLHTQPWTDLPDGTYVLADEQPAVVVADQLVVWRPDNTYGDRLPRPRSGTATVITPAATVAVLRAGYPVQISAGPTPRSQPPRRRRSPLLPR